MRLSNSQVRDVLHQLDADVIPGDDPATAQLEMVFGQHTFFLGDEGLHVVERGPIPSPEGDPAFIVRIAHWADGDHTRLEPQRAEVARTVDIGPSLADLPEIEVEDEDGGMESEQDLFAGHGRDEN